MTLYTQDLYIPCIIQQIYGHVAAHRTVHNNRVSAHTQVYEH